MHLVSGSSPARENDGITGRDNLMPPFDCKARHPTPLTLPLAASFQGAIKAIILNAN
ncbi:MAG: hypothetical protein KA004_13865 [Verrucomicrobiales bacterium]|nr:hypothetical protein [Verrucomicrobiales bacterium]